MAREVIAGDASYVRKYPTTGYWLFVCNTNYWNADAWLELGSQELLYKISKHHARDMVAGQLGLLRLNKDRRSRATRGARPAHEAGIYAVVELTGQPVLRSDPDPRGYNLESDADEVAWRVPVRIIANLLKNPVLSSNLPADDAFRHIHLPLNTSTLALGQWAFEFILAVAGIPSPSDASKLTADPETLANSIAGIRLLEKQAGNDTPKLGERKSHYIERGTVGRAVKRLRQGRCQLCEAMGREPIAFLDRKGRPYSEAHHVIPVSSLQAGALSYLNIMVLCPNHHRQAHLGLFSVVEDKSSSWVLSVDGVPIEIEKPPEA